MIQSATKPNLSNTDEVARLVSEFEACTLARVREITIVSFLRASYSE